MQKRIVAMFLVLVMVMALLPLGVWAEEVGSVDNPADLTIGDNAATLMTGDTDGYTFAYTAGQDGVLSVLMSSADWKYSIHNVTKDVAVGPYTSNDDTLMKVGTMELSEGDVVHVTVSTYNPSNPGFTPYGKVTFSATFPDPLGDWLNPAPLSMGSNTVEIAEGSYGYYYSWTAEEDGILNITMPDMTEEVTIPGWCYSLSNFTQEIYGDFCYSDSVSNEASIEVAAGDEIELVVCTYDPEAMTAPAGTLTVDAVFSYPQGSAKAPIALSESTVVTIPAGKTLYYTGRFGGQYMTAVGAGVTLEHNGKTYVLTNGDTSFTCYQQDINNPSVFVLTNTTDADVDVSLTIVIPVGTRENPAQLELDENIAEITDGNDQGYYFTFTAPEDGQLQLTMPDGNWQYVVNNLTSGRYGSNCTSADDPVVNPAVIDVKADQKLQIIINSFDPADLNRYPAATLYFQASFQGQGGSETHTHTYTYQNNGDNTHTGVCACDEVLIEEHSYINGFCVCGAVEAGSDQIAGSQTTGDTYDGCVQVEYTPAADGVLAVDLSSTVGHKIEICLDDGTSLVRPKTVNSANPTTGSYTYDVKADVHYTIKIWGYMDWGEAVANITYIISFTPSAGDAEIEKVAYQVDRTQPLSLGDNDLSLLETAVTTLYVFTPAEMGVYTITAPEGAILGYWGAGEWFLNDPNSTTNTYEWTCTSVGQGAYIGVTNVGSNFQLNIAKTGDYNPIVYTEVEYINQAELVPFEVPSCFTLGSYVDVSEPHTAVLGADGYYHLDSEDGDILLMDLNHQDIVLSNKLNSDIPTMYLYTDEQLDDGSYIKYDIRYAIAKNDKDEKLSYEEVMSPEGYYPLTEDLIRFYKEYATAHGVWSFYLTGTEYDQDTVWMYCCITAKAAHKDYTYIEDTDDKWEYDYLYTCACGIDAAKINLWAHAWDMTYYVGGYGAMPGRYQCTVDVHKGDEGYGEAEWYDIAYGDPIVENWPTEAGTYTVNFEKTTAIEGIGDKEFNFQFAMNITVLELPATSGQCGDNMFWSFDTTNDTLTISGTGDMYEIAASLDDFWNENYTYEPGWWYLPVKHIIVEEGVENLSNFAFFQGWNSYYEIHETIQLPTTLEKIPEMSLMCSTAMTSLVIPEGITSLTGWPFGSFGNSFMSLTELHLPATLTEFDITTIMLCGLNNRNAQPTLQTIYFAGTQEQWDAIEHVQSEVIRQMFGDDYESFYENWCKPLEEYFATVEVICTGKEEKPVELIKWVGTQLQATSNLDMQFALKAADLNGTTGNYIVLTRTYVDGSTDAVTIPQSQWTASGDFYIVAYSGIAAKEMNDVISAVAYNANGEVISETRSESIVTYALSMLGKITNPEQKTMFVDLLNYGAEAQKFFHYDEAHLANAGLTDAQKALATQEDIEVSDQRVKGPNFFGSQLSLENVILLQMAFKVAPAEGMYAIASFTNHNGKKVEETLAVENNNGYSMVSVNSLAIADYCTDVTVTLYNADGSVAGSAVDSMASYVARSKTDLGKAIMKFGASAYAYFH